MKYNSDRHISEIGYMKTTTVQWRCQDEGSHNLGIAFAAQGSACHGLIRLVMRNNGNGVIEYLCLAVWANNRWISPAVSSGLGRAGTWRLSWARSSALVQPSIRRYRS